MDEHGRAVCLYVRKIIYDGNVTKGFFSFLLFTEIWSLLHTYVEQTVFLGIFCF